MHRSRREGGKERGERDRERRGGGKAVKRGRGVGRKTAREKVGEEEERGREERREVKMGCGKEAERFMSKKIYYN